MIWNNCIYDLHLLNLDGNYLAVIQQYNIGRQLIVQKIAFLQEHIGAQGHSSFHIHPGDNQGVYLGRLNRDECCG